MNNENRKDIFERLGKLEQRKARLEQELQQFEDFREMAEGYVQGLDSEISELRKQINSGAKVALKKYRTA